MTTRNSIRFLLNDREMELADAGSCDTLLDFLRLDQRMTGTKEGCAEGDCGACTVLVGRRTGEGLKYEAINACIRFLASVDGCHVVTIEHMRGADGNLHPVQQAMVEHHGSQCGFCTPGIVMSLYALWMENPSPTEIEVETALQGNLCRCTGYEPILRAAQTACSSGGQASDALTQERDTVRAVLDRMADGTTVDMTKGADRVILPATVKDLAAAFADAPDATIVAGATDVGLWVTKFLRPISPVIHIAHLEELRRIDEDQGVLSIGAGASYSDAMKALTAHWPHLRDYWLRIGGWQVRNAGTIGGNIANGSPIGDSPPVLIALGARVYLRHGSKTRSLPLQDYFVDYGKQDRAPGEFVERIDIPLPKPGQHHAAYKISKRKDEDISSVAAGIFLTVEADRITDARLAFGGMAATPKRAEKAEAALIGQPFTAASFDAAAEALARDFTPLTDWRASDAYRMLAAQNLLRRFWAERQDGPTRLSDVEAVA